MTTENSKELVLHANGAADLNNMLTSNKDKLIFIDFWAPWCGPCRMLGPVLEKLASEYNQITVIKVDVDSGANQELAMQYGISSIPQVNIIKNGVEVDQFVGALPYDVIKQYIEKYIK